tara:strand:- start:52625 stop:52963 length:339 start_codon:yes stop_codon:yes gene_type:complete
MSENVDQIIDISFDEVVLKSNIPFLVDFWAEWCGPCRMVDPIVKELSNEYDGKIKFGKMNVDENPIVPPKYGIRSIPSLLIFHKGNVFEQIVGAVPKENIKLALDRVLTKND